MPPAAPSEQVTIIQPDDWHLHLRQGAMLQTVLPHTTRVFARAIVMPNTRPPVVTTAQARAYRDEILACLPKGHKFQPLMTLYLTDGTDPADVRAGHALGVVTAIKLYPAHATTNSEHGVTDLKNVYKVFEAMQDLGMPLLIHGEVTDPDVDIFDREAVFMDKVMPPLLKDFPKLKIVLEHLTTRRGVAFVRAHGASKRLAATITAHHLHINRNAMFQGGMRPHFYCLPVAKREQDRQALIEAATSGEPWFFLGTDSAPHSTDAKESACACAGIYTAPQALELYAEVFDAEGKLNKLESFASCFGPDFYGLPINKTEVVLTRVPHQKLHDTVKTKDAQKISVFGLPKGLGWRADVKV